MEKEMDKEATERNQDKVEIKESILNPSTDDVSTKPVLIPNPNHQATDNLTKTESSSSLPADTVKLAIKCPSLYQDPELINVTKQTTVGQVKSLVSATWPGRPSLEGMRCISAGRLLTDEDLVGDIAASTDSAIPTASLHLVIRPDAWITPPQLPISAISGSRQGSRVGTPADVLAGSSYFGSPTPDTSSNPNQVPHITTTTPTAVNTSSLGIHPNFSASPLQSPGIGISSQPLPTSPSFSFSPTTPTSIRPNPSTNQVQSILSPEKRIAKLLEKLPASQYALVKEMLLVGHGCYLDRYRKLWKELYPNNNDSDDKDEDQSLGTEAPVDFEKEMSLRVLERDILDWPELPTSVVDEGQKEVTYVYEQISLDGLPYLVRVESTLWLQESSSLLHEYHSRLCILQRLCVKMDRMIGYSRMGSVLSSGGTNGVTTSYMNFTPQHLNLDPQARAQAIQGLENLQRRIAAATGQPIPAAADATANPAATAARLTTIQRSLARRRNRRFFPHPTDLGNIFAPVLFLLFKVSILLYVVARNASPLKRHVLAFTAAAYVLYQASLLLKRARRLRHAAERARRLAVNGGDPGDRLARRMAQRRAAPQGANAAHRPAAAGGVGGGPRPTAPTDQSQTAGGTSSSTDDPYAPPPPLYAPVRHRATSPSTLQWWSEQIAYAGMAREDMQLGLLPPRPPLSSNNNQGGNQERSILQIIFPFAFQDLNQARQHPPSALGPLDFLPTFLLALLLFVGTLIPHIELMRRKAIEDRENIIGIAARKEEERKEKREEIERLRKEAERKLKEEEESKRGKEDSGEGSSQEVGIEEGDESTKYSKEESNAGLVASSSTSASHSQLQPLPEAPAPPQVLASEYSERVLRGQNLAGGIRPGAELDLEAEHEAARRAQAGDPVDTDDTDGAEDPDGEAGAVEDAEEDMGFF